jgi:hypothetical protein
VPFWVLLVSAYILTADIYRRHPCGGLHS